MVTIHEKFMRLALIEAQKAEKKGEVPIGAVMVSNAGEIMAKAHNLTITSADPSAHAEMLCMRQAAKSMSNYRLLNTTLYVSIEPCLMCMGAVIHARLETVVFGAKDPKWGAAGSLYDFSSDRRLNHEVKVIQGVLEEECRALMQAFFRKKRIR